MRMTNRFWKQPTAACPGKTDDCVCVCLSVVTVTLELDSSHTESLSLQTANPPPLSPARCHTQPQVTKQSENSLVILAWFWVLFLTFVTYVNYCVHCPLSSPVFISLISLGVLIVAGPWVHGQFQFLGQIAEIQVKYYLWLKTIQRLLRPLFFPNLNYQYSTTWEWDSTGNVLSSLTQLKLS